MKKEVERQRFISFFVLFYRESKNFCTFAGENLKKEQYDILNDSSTHDRAGSTMGWLTLR